MVICLMWVFSSVFGSPTLSLLFQALRLLLLFVIDYIATSLFTQKPLCPTSQFLPIVHYILKPLSPTIHDVRGQGSLPKPASLAAGA